MIFSRVIKVKVMELKVQAPYVVSLPGCGRVMSYLKPHFGICNMGLNYSPPKILVRDKYDNVCKNALLTIKNYGV